MASSVDDFARNLRLICGHWRSISEVCREIGINRQQFNRYLNGTTRPSSHNLQRICLHLNVSVDELLRPHEEFAARCRLPGFEAIRDPRDRYLVLANRALSGDRVALRRYVGYYHSYFLAPQMEDAVMRAFVCLYESEGRFFSKSIERSKRTDASARFVSKYEGVASYLGGRIFLVEFETLSADAVVETILFPSYRRRLNCVTGLTFGVTSHEPRVPFASRVAWKYLGKVTNTRRALADCGILPINSPTMDRSILRMLTTPPEPALISAFDWA